MKRKPGNSKRSELQQKHGAADATKKRRQQQDAQPCQQPAPQASKGPCQQLQDMQQQQQQQQQQATPAGAAADGVSTDDPVRRLFRSWAWKREHRPDKDRFHRPYTHPMAVQASSSSSSSSAADGGGGGADRQQQQLTLTIKQQRFAAEGFASTVWDSSIVVAKFLEKRGAAALRHCRCLDLSAGCGLVGVVMAKLGAAQVTVTDLAPNLPLLQHNCTANSVPEVVVLEHRWGSDVQQLSPPFDVVVACDVMYVQELVGPLLASLLALTHPTSEVFLAHGRNRPAEPTFRAAAAQHFDIQLVGTDELDEVYQCSDVDVLRLLRRGP